MGITGLIPFLEKASTRVQLKDIRGCTVAVDTYCWLHKGVFSCADKLARGEDTDLYVQYCLKYVQMLLSYDIKPILVFDGQHLPAKALTEQRRRESRQQSKKRAAELLRLGRVEEARSQMRRCVDVTHEMALRLIKECRIRNVDCIVAPYEADAQMAWLNKVGIAQYIVTEDSDLTLFGAQKVIFKLDLTGGGLLVDSQKLYLAMGCIETKYHFDKFRRMCILSGCDYLDSLPGIGLAKACKFMLKTEQEDMRKALKMIPLYLNMRNLEVDDEYIENFMKAEATFKHMFIYNPLERRMERLCALTDYETDEQYCSNAGSLLTDSDQALHLALGNLDPFTFKRLDSWQPEHAAGLQPAPEKHIKRARHASIWQANFRKDATTTAAVPTQEDQAKCALYFKKVDFVSQTIDNEIADNLRVEQAKQTEAELFCMYNLRMKRKRNANSDSSTECERTPPASPAQTKSRHNPFAKERTTEDSQRSPVVCENSSLLRVLSPKKLNQLTADEIQQTRVETLKRSIFAKEAQVQVRSRFFATATDIQTNKPATTKGDEEMKIDMQINAEISEEKMGMESIEISDAESQSANDAAMTDEQINTGKSKEETRMQSTKISDTESQPVNDAVVVLLSDESSDATLPSSQDTNSSNSLKAYQVQHARRVGLSKTKTAKKSTTAKLGAVQPNQSKLSMFGFQKRPVLK